MAPFGGEEFVIVLPKIDTDGALILLKRIREDLANKPLKWKEDKIYLTVSINSKTGTQQRWTLDAQMRQCIKLKKVVETSVRSIDHLTTVSR